jgi:hypothetical protein
MADSAGLLILLRHLAVLLLPFVVVVVVPYALLTALQVILT